MTELCSKKRRGFNLIESAIVLGVVGLVVAGIWAAAVTISEKREINNAKDFILYQQGLALKYSRNYPLPSNYLQINKLLPNDLPGNFKLEYYGGTTGWAISENNKVYADALLANVYSQDGYNVSGSFNWWMYFTKDALATPWVWAPRPSLCAGLLSWTIGYAATHPVLLGYSLDLSNPNSNRLYWDARTGAAPPNVSICQNVTLLDVFFF